MKELVILTLLKTEVLTKSILIKFGISKTIQATFQIKRIFRLIYNLYKKYNRIENIFLFEVD